MKPQNHICFVPVPVMGHRLLFKAVSRISLNQVAMASFTAGAKSGEHR